MGRGSDMYSFDVFDTLITRYTFEPKGIFVLMQEIMQRVGEYDSFLISNFYELRTGAEELARVYATANGKREITLDDIYRSLMTTACITLEQKEKLKKLEIETEYNNVIGISKNIELLKELKNKKAHMVLISDMYLSEKDIRRMLCKADSIFNEIPIYVSSDYGMTKSCGELYRLVKSREKVEYSDWIHYGDNEYADIEAASKLGIKAIHLIPRMLREYEQPQRDVYHQLSIGASSYIRSGLKGKNLAVEVGSSLAGPILYPYINWVIDQSINREINRLYFVARDGWILKQIADLIIKLRKYPIRTYYIYGSRKAWRLPSYDGSVKDFDRFLLWSNMNEVLCLDDLAEVFHLKLEKLKYFLPEQFKNINETQYLSNFQKDNICGQLRVNKDFRNFLVEEQVENRNLLIRYLKQEMDLSDDKYAFVELLGTGYTQKCLARVVENFYDGEIKNFYLKLDSIQEEEQCRFLNFYPSNMKRSYMLELLCRAPHGQTKAYAEKESGIIPILEEYEGEQLEEYGIEEYKTAILDYVRQMEQAYSQNGLGYFTPIDIIREYMEVIAINPPEEIAQYFCHMPFSSGGRKNKIIEFAPAITKKQLRKIYFWNDVENVGQVYQGDSLDYALVVSDQAEHYKKKCQKYGKTCLGTWIKGVNRYLRTHQKIGIDYFCPWEFLRGTIVIYGAGKVGQAYVKQARLKDAKCDNLLWVDSNYDNLRKIGLDVNSPDEIKEYSFDRIIIAIHNTVIRQEIWDKLHQMGIEAGKIYYG